jgi:hypothetical protein
MHMDLWHQILEFFGVIGESGKGYGFWSGVGSDIGELGIIGGLAVLVRHHVCHVHRCWRVGRHQTPGEGNTVHTVCKRHHPDPQVHNGLTHAHLLHLHKVHLEKVAGSQGTTIVTQDN